MTDEELAEKYAMNCPIPLSLFQEDKKELMKTTIKRIFLAGLKAAKPQWHDLRKDPNDLPKNKRNVWCYYGDGSGKGYYSKDLHGWWIEGHMFCSAIDAWCELPTFDKE